MCSHVVDSYIVTIGKSETVSSFYFMKIVSEFPTSTLCKISLCMPIHINNQVSYLTWFANSRKPSEVEKAS
jgi:hypothetical protein